ncbi:conserved hypothetical protein [Candidatus Protochlamydia naegleriophila]|uniref:Uncharacterized protein n=1 Tax=Candidatus Protochlamydia naegleriophila TaxID=389348 RepID=A0A0U5EU10_9BACT|nr:hypothetical protein [Candidatus Protochlamydia naegleriophila]CUI17744.1 conserved hypothetical protein [Candidatus Protochlamydia naegleriophila]
MSVHPPLSVRFKAAPPLQASKWLKCPVLLDIDEMEDLFRALGDFWIFSVSGVLPSAEGEMTQAAFLTEYGRYIEALKRGEFPDEQRARPYFSTVFTTSTDALYEVVLPNQQKLIRVERPVIQLQSHRFDYSPVDGKFRSMVLGQNSIQWGIQFSYPQLFQDAACQVKQVRESEEFPNTVLFKRMQKWVRDHTTATPFLVENNRVNVPIRLGKTCFGWINQHPQLQAKGLVVLHHK